MKLMEKGLTSAPSHFLQTPPPRRFAYTIPSYVHFEAFGRHCLTIVRFGISVSNFFCLEKVKKWILAILSLLFCKNNKMVCTLQQNVLWFGR
jgi:hypothetical protein